MNDETRLNELFANYRSACPEVEPGVNFMPLLWQKIEARHSFLFIFERLGRTAMAAVAVLVLLLVALNFTSSRQLPGFPSYPDALMADHSAEKTYYTEAIRSKLSPEEVPPALR